MGTPNIQSIPNEHSFNTISAGNCHTLDRVTMAMKIISKYVLDLAKISKLPDTRLDELSFGFSSNCCNRICNFWKVPVRSFLISCVSLHWLSIVPKYLFRILGYVQQGRKCIQTSYRHKQKFMKTGDLMG